MIGSLRGRVIEQSEETLVLDVNGVGYELTCSINTLSEAAGREEIQLSVHTQLREDALTLFGFSTLVEKKMFLSLLKVNGVGPKLAVKILSGGTLDYITNLIESGDVKGLSNLPKVGKKTAEQLILSLKGKLVLEAQTPAKAGRSTAAALVPRFTGVRGEILSALVNLGFRLQDAEQAVVGMEEDIDLQKGVRQGLQVLTGSF